MEVSRAILERAAQSPRGLPDSTAASIQQRTTTCPGPPVCRFVADSFQCIRTCCYTTCPSPQDLECAVWFRSRDLRLTWIKVRESCAVSSASLSLSLPILIQWQDESRRLEIGWDAVDGQQRLVAQRSMCLAVPYSRSTTLAGPPFCPLNHIVVSSAQSAEPGFTCKGDITLKPTGCGMLTRQWRLWWAGSSNSPYKSVGLAHCLKD